MCCWLAVTRAELSFQIRPSSSSLCPALAGTSSSRCVPFFPSVFFLCVLLLLVAVAPVQLSLLCTSVSFRLASSPFLLLFVPPSPLPCVLVTLAFPALSRSLSLCVLTCPYARLLCCLFVFYLPHLRALPVPCPSCPLRTSLSFPYLFDPCSFLFSCAVALVSCLLHVSLVCAVYLLCHPSPPFSISLYSLSQI